MNIDTAAAALADFPPDCHASSDEASEAVFATVAS